MEGKPPGRVTRGGGVKKPSWSRGMAPRTRSVGGVGEIAEITQSHRGKRGGRGGNKNGRGRRPRYVLNSKKTLLTLLDSFELVLLFENFILTNWELVFFFFLAKTLLIC